MFALILLTSRSTVPEYARLVTVRCTDFLILDAATSSIALVILRVLATDLIRRLISRGETGMGIMSVQRFCSRFQSLFSFSCLTRRQTPWLLQVSLRDPALPLLRNHGS